MWTSSAGSSSIDPEDADLVRDAYRQVAALDPEDEQTPARVSTLVRGMADVLDGADEMAHGDEARQYLVAVEPGLHWGAEDIGLNVNRLRESRGLHRESCPRASST